MAVIEKNEPATIVICSKCGGHIMSGIDRFMDIDDLKAIAAAEAAGMTIKKTDVRAFNGNWEDCICKAVSAPVKVEEPNRIKKVTLSLASIQKKKKK